MVERDGATRYREIQESATGLVAWYREFVSDVRDHRGVPIRADLDEFIEELGDALRPLPTGPRQSDKATPLVGKVTANTVVVVEGNIDKIDM